MKAERITTPIKNSLNSEPAAFLGGMLTVHRKLDKPAIILRGAVDGFYAFLALDSLMTGQAVDASLLTVPLAFRAVDISRIYLSKKRTHKS